MQENIVSIGMPIFFQALSFGIFYAMQLAGARGEAREIIEAANRRGDILISEARRQAREQSEGLLRRAREEIQQEKKQAFHELRGQVGQLSILVAGEILKENLDPSAQERVIDASLDRLAGAP